MPTSLWGQLMPSRPVPVPRSTQSKFREEQETESTRKGDQGHAKKDIPPRTEVFLLQEHTQACRCNPQFTNPARRCCGRATRFPFLILSPPILASSALAIQLQRGRACRLTSAAFWLSLRGCEEHHQVGHKLCQPGIHVPLRPSRKYMVC